MPPPYDSAEFSLITLLFTVTLELPRWTGIEETAATEDPAAECTEKPLIERVKLLLIVLLLSVTLALSPSLALLKDAASEPGRVVAERAIVDGQLRVITVDAAACVRRKSCNRSVGGPAVCDR